MTTRTEWLIDYILGPCTCGSAYKDGMLASDQCSLCNDHEEARESLLLAYQLGHDENGTQHGHDHVALNREHLKELLNLMRDGLQQQ